MASGNQPDWLPPGWIQVTYYRNTKTGEEFCFKEDVIRSVNMGNISNIPPQPMGEDNEPMDEDNKLYAQTKTKVDQLTEDSSSEPSVSGIKCSISKPKKECDTRHSLKSNKVCLISLCNFNKDSTPYFIVYKLLMSEVISRLMGVGLVDGLPRGWKRETRTRKSGRKDPYYIDPDGVYEFRSKPDALSYIKTGDIKQCKIKPNRRNIKSTESINEDNAPPSAATEFESSNESQDYSVSADGSVSYQKHHKPERGSGSVSKASSGESGSVLTAKFSLERIGTRLIFSKNKTGMPLPPCRSSEKLKVVDPGDPLFNEEAICSAARGKTEGEGEKPAADGLAVQGGRDERESPDKPNGERTEGKES